MKCLLGTLYVMSEDAYLSLDNENIVVSFPNATSKKIPLLNVQNILCFSFKGASPALMGECVKRNIGISFYSPFGRFLARANGISIGNVLLRKEQYRIADQDEGSCKIAKNFISGKIYNSHSLIRRIARDHEHSVNREALEHCASELMIQTRLARNCQDLETLRGIEGHAAQLYFGIFGQLILNSKTCFKFNGRNKRPPKDPVNALLSFLYVVLANDCANALEGVGLDSYVGFLHRDRPGRKSLSLDLMEELRSVFVDRCVLYLINNRMLSDNDFYFDENGAVMLNADAKKTILTEWEKRKKDTITHPFLGEKVAYGLIPHIQAMLLARYLRGDMEEYPAFLWK